MLVSKWHCVVNYLLRAELLFCLMREIMPAATEVDLQPHCIQMSRDKEGKTFHEFHPIQMNDTEFPEPHFETDDILVEICPNKTTLKMSWKMKRNTGGDMQLYYRLKGIFSGQLLLYRCVKLPLQYSNQRSHIMCWFPMRYLSYRPIISAYASSLTDGQPQQSYFGELNTNILADGDSCKHVCDMTNIQIKPVILCSHKSYVKFDTSVSMRGLYLYPIDSTICKKTTRKHISKKKSNKLEFSLNCSHSGLVNITVYFRTHGHYCSKYYTVRLICDSATTTSVFSVFSTEAKNNSKSTTYLYITLGIFLSTLVNAVIVYFVCQRSRKIPRVRQNLDDINIGIDGHVEIPLNVLNNQSNNVTADDEDFSSTPCIIEMITKV